MRGRACLAAAVEWHAREFERRSGIAVEVTSAPDDLELDAEAAAGRLAAIVDSAEDAIFTFYDGVICDWNPGAERVFGWTAAEAIGMLKTTLVPLGRRAESDSIAGAVHRGDNVQHLETVRVRKDGASIDVSLTISPLRDATGKVTGCCVIARDITETKRLRERVAIADRMASLGTLAAGVAHEINNPLSVVIANIDMALESAIRRCVAPDAKQDTTEIVEELRDAMDAADRVRLIVQDLKLFSLPDDRPKTRVDVRDVLNGTLRMVANEVRHRAKLVTEYHDVPTVDANESRLGQVFLNLLVNAAHAIPQGNSESNEIRVVVSVEAGSVVIEIRDTGAGIDPVQLARIFEPFVTTKAIGVGTGLGLPICRTIIDSLGGELTLTSVLGRGSSAAGPRETARARPDRGRRRDAAQGARARPR